MFGKFLTLSSSAQVRHAIFTLASKWTKVWFSLAIHCNPNQMRPSLTTAKQLTSRNLL